MCMLTLANGDALSPFFPQSRQFEWTDVVLLLILIGLFFLGRWSTSTTTTTTSSSSTSLPRPPGQSSSSSSRTRPLTTTSTSTSTSTTRMRSTSRPTSTSDDPPMAGGVELSARLDALPEQSSLLEEEGATSSASGGLHAPPDEQLQESKNFDIELQRLQPLQQMMRKLKFFLQENFILGAYPGMTAMTAGGTASFLQKKTWDLHLQMWAWSSESTTS